MDEVKDSPADQAHQRKSSQISLLILATLAVAAALTFLGPIIKPFLIAVFLFFTTKNLAEYLIKKGVPAWLSYSLLLVFSFVVMLSVSIFVYSEIVTFRVHWPKYQDRVSDLIKENGENFTPALQDLFNISSKEIFTYAFERGVDFVELFILTFFYLVFLILGSSKLAHRVKTAFPGDTGERALFISEKIENAMERFIRVKTLVSAGMALSAAFIMYLFKLDHWPVWAFMLFALNYVTYIGSMFALFPPAAMAFLDLENPWLAVLLIALIILNRLFWVDWVEIRLTGKQMNLDPLIIFLWLSYWGWTWGVLGLILAYPMLVSLKIVLENLPRTRPWAILMSEE